MSQSLPYLPLEGSSTSLESRILLLPVVSTANISQLAVDLIISTLGLTRLGIFDDECLIPAVGAREGGQEGITTALEVFGKADLEFVVLQQRSPVLKGRKESFVAGLSSWIAESKFSAVIFLVGIDLSNRTDALMSSSTYILTPSSTVPPLPSTIDISSIPRFTAENSTETTSSTLKSRLPGSGLLTNFLSTPHLKGVPRAAVLQYVMEGDNRLDAHEFTRKILKMLKKDKNAVTEPESWSGLFGRSGGNELFG